jgi:hypothetical protein
MVDAWRESGESRSAFARRYGFAVHRLTYRLPTTAEAPPSATAREPITFHLVQVVPDRVDAARSAPIEICVIRVPRGVLPDELRAVLAALDFRD